MQNKMRGKLPLILLHTGIKIGSVKESYNFTLSALLIVEIKRVGKIPEPNNASLE